MVSIIHRIKVRNIEVADFVANFNASVEYQSACRGCACVSSSFRVVCSVIYQEAATIDVLSPFFLSLAAFYELPRIPVMRSSRGFPALFPNAPVRALSEESTLATLLRFVGLPGWYHPPRSTQT